MRPIAAPGQRWAAEPMKRVSRSVGAMLLASSMGLAMLAHAQEQPEYRLKAAFLYNFIVFTEWPADTGTTLNLCIHGTDPFGKELDALQGGAAGPRSLALHRRPTADGLKGCQVVFVAANAIGSLPRVLEEVRDRATLVVADSPGAARQGAALNMTVAQDKVRFEANLQAARSARLSLSSKLLRLAVEVYP